MKFESQIYCPNCDDFFHLIEKMDGWICEQCRRILVYNSYERNGIAVGDEVIVTNPGSGYDMYAQFADLYQLSNWSSELPDRVVHRVLLVAPHGDRPTKLCYVIENLYTGKQYIIGPDGIQKTCSAEKTGIHSLRLEEELFEI